ITPDGKTLIVDIGEHLFVFDTATGKQRSKIAHTYHDSGGSTSLSANHKHVVASWYGWGDISVFELGGAEHVRKTLPGRRAGPAALSSDGRSFATGFDDEILIYETATGGERRRISGFRGRVESLAFFPDGRRLASGMSDSTVLIWDLTAAPK